jgi:hypothetical protein
MDRVQPYKNQVVAGTRYGKLVIVQRVHDKKTKTANLKVQVRVRCDCGQRLTIPFYYLVRTHHTPKTECGMCGPKSLQSKHKREFSSWYMMNVRCTDEKHMAYKTYGGRGIKVCDRWSWDNEKGFANFWEDMGERPEGRTLDRINNNRGYYKENCRWATPVEQRANQGHAPIPDDEDTWLHNNGDSLLDS